MRRQRNCRNHFIDLTLSCLGVFVIGLSVIKLFAELFGEMIIPSIPMISLFLTIPVIGFLVGIVGWIWTEHSRWQDY